MFIINLIFIFKGRLKMQVTDLRAQNKVFLKFLTINFHFSRLKGDITDKLDEGFLYCGKTQNYFCFLGW